ncbi:MAG: DUF1854 domain-containing protein [Candidatus Omnitrophica bacterium]|nr:DUF1854 domain-containing protein [Candidatus Omnitrophota bacterium]MCM8807654.1 DUF1854 domain-containing protein [Candidatus Omnitrophota bacterium]
MNDKLKFLTSKNTKILKGEFETMDVYFVETETLYKNVFAISCFPIREPLKFISLFYQKENGEFEEIGIIKDIFDFSENERRLILKTLNKHYFSYKIIRIFDIKWKFGFLLFHVLTDKGEKEFYLKWERSKTIDFGKKGKILIDVFEDRYLIEDIESFSPMEKNMFKRFIYW